MGSGFRTFTAGEVLTASNVQNYLQDQVVMTFGGSATRASAIGTANFEEGMVSYLTDTDKMEVYNGTNWVSVAPTASTPMGVHLSTVTFSGVSSQSINDVFSATYSKYRINLILKGTNNGQVRMRLRVSGSDNSSTNYRYQYLSASNTSVAGSRGTAQTVWLVGRTNGDVSQYCFSQLEVMNPFETTYATGYTEWSDAHTGNIDISFLSLGIDVTTSYTGFTIIAEAGTMEGSIHTYGYNE